MYPERTYNLLIRAAKNVFPGATGKDRAALIATLESYDDEFNPGYFPGVFCTSDAELHLRACVEDGTLDDWAPETPGLET